MSTQESTDQKPATKRKLMPAERRAAIGSLMLSVGMLFTLVGTALSQSAEITDPQLRVVPDNGVPGGVGAKD